MDYFNELLQTLHKIAIEFITKIPNIVSAVIFFIITFIIAKIFAHIVGVSLARTPLRTNLVHLFKKLISILIWFIGLLIICAILFPSVTTANLITVLGIGSIAIGFAFKDIFSNFLAGILILLREPFHIGDFIESKDQEGTVEEISVRNTHLRRTDGVRIVIPNSMIFNNPIRVLTDMNFRRAQACILISHKEKIEQVRNLIHKTIQDCKTVCKDRNIQIYVKELSGGNTEFELTWWTQSKPSDIRLSRDEVLSKVKIELDNQDIEIPHCYTLNFEGTLPIESINENSASNNKSNFSEK